MYLLKLELIKSYPSLLSMRMQSQVRHDTRSIIKFNNNMCTVNNIRHLHKCDVLVNGLRGHRIATRQYIDYKKEEWLITISIRQVDY